MVMTKKKTTALRGNGHHQYPVMDRFMYYVIPEPNSGCWLWMGYVMPIGPRRTGGYGAFKIGKSALKAHRVSYELFKGPIPDGLTIDHLCSLRCCVNPDHLEAVPLVVNIKRGRAGQFQASRIQCPQGHPYDDANTGYTTTKRGKQRHCRACKRQQTAKSREKRKKS